MDELKKIVDMVADKNYIWVILTFGDKNTFVHTAHNGTWRLSELQGDLKAIVDFMVANNIAEIANYSRYTNETWKNGSLVRFDGRNEKDVIKSVISLLGAKYNKTDVGNYVMNERIDGIRYYSMVSGKSYEVAV